MYKHRENRKTLPSEHHIGWEMCEIALSISTENEVFYSIDSSDSSGKFHATSPQKIMQPF